MNRLRAKFTEFQNSRDTLSDILDDYTADYRQTQGSTLKRQEVLQEKYSKRAPRFSHLIWNDDDNSELWTAADIAIVLGRDKSSVTRTLAAREIFNIIIDRYEDEYLQRFANPRHGMPQNIDEIKRFWDYLKQSAEHERINIASNSEPEEYELPDIPQMSWKDIFSLIWRKIFTVRTGTFFTVIFAVSFEIARRWHFMKTFFLIGAIIILGASAILFSLLWTAGMTSGEVNAQTSGMLSHKDIIMQEADGWVEVYKINDETFVTVKHVLYSDLANDTIEALEYGINSQPYKVIKRENLQKYYEKIMSTHDDSIEFVTSRIIFTDKSKSGVRKFSLNP